MTVTSWAGLPSCWEDAAVPSDDYVSLLLLLLIPWSSSPFPAPSFSPLSLHQEPSPGSSPISPPSQPFKLHQMLLLLLLHLSRLIHRLTHGWLFKSNLESHHTTPMSPTGLNLISISPPLFPTSSESWMVRRLFEILVPCVLIETRLQSFQQHPICIAQSFLAYYWVSGSFYLPLIYSIYGRRTTLIEKQRRTCWNRKQ